MKSLLYGGAVCFLCAAFLDPLYASGMGRPIPWLRDLVMAVLGVACYYLLIRYRKIL
jgi:hypothetical protein